MNERIKQLAGQAGLTFVNSITDDNEDIECVADTNGGLPCSTELEKFAELIVQECATTCDNIGKEARKEWKAKYIPHDDGRSDGAWECKAAILEHFGVEE